MVERLFMGVDIGTSGIRAAAFDMDGGQVSLCYKEYPMICDQEGMAELDPEGIFKSFIHVVKECIEQGKISSTSIEAIGLSSQMHSFLAVDKEGNCLTGVITWADTRSIDDAYFIEKNFNSYELYNKTGCRTQHPIYPVSKIMWFKRSRPDLFSKVHKFVTIKEYIIYKLFGEYTVDITDASATGCFNIHKFTWDEDILKDVLGIGYEKLGDTAECTYSLKNMKNEFACEMGLSPSTPVVIGSGDGIMANVGCGGFDNTTMSCTIGTSGALRIAVDTPVLDKQQRTWCYCFTKDKWVAGGAVNNGGIILKWFRDQYRIQFEKEAESLQLKDVYELFDTYVSEVGPGSNGVFFLPYLTGERSPGWNADASGYICGLRITHDKGHIIRAAMEGIMYNMYSVFELIENIDGNVKRIVANGGYVNSDVWLQIQADIFNKDIIVAGIGEAAVFGAAYTAMVAVGALNGFKDVLPKSKPAKVIKPIADNNQIYQGTYKQFKSLYSELIVKK